MSWLFSQVLVEAYSEANSSDGELSVPSSGNPTQQAFLSHGKMTGFSRLSRFGMTFKPLTDSRGEALLKWFLEGFPAPTFHQQERVLESTEKPLPCGSIWLESAVKYCLAISGWRTHRCLWEEVLPESSVTLPQWGMMQDGVLWERTMPAHLTNETESGSWPTPTVDDAHNVTRKSGAFQSLTRSVMMFPAPTAHNAKETGAPSQLKRQTVQLGDLVGGKLNPTWVEWLMGWTLGWTDLRPLGMGKFQGWLDLHGKSYQKEATDEMP